MCEREKERERHLHTNVGTHPAKSTCVHGAKRGVGHGHTPMPRAFGRVRSAICQAIAPRGIRTRFGTRAASSYSARSVGGRGQTRGVVVVEEKWAHVVRTPPDRKVVGTGPVGSGHGSYQLVSWWGGQCWCPPMAHAQWWQSGSAIRDVATSAHHGMRSPFGWAKRTPRAMLRRRRDVADRAP